MLHGNLAPNAAILKPSAASSHLLVSSGRAVVSSSVKDFKARFDEPALDVDETSVLALQNSGLRGYPGMAEVGNMALPKKLLEKGVRDMVRVSDARIPGKELCDDERMSPPKRCRTENAVFETAALASHGARLRASLTEFRVDVAAVISFTALGIPPA